MGRPLKNLGQKERKMEGELNLRLFFIFGGLLFRVSKGHLCQDEERLVGKMKFSACLKRKKETLKVLGNCKH